MLQYVVAPGEVHYDHTKWKRIRDAIMRFQKEDNTVLSELAKGVQKSQIVLDSDAEESEAEELAWTDPRRRGSMCGDLGQQQWEGGHGYSRRAHGQSGTSGDPQSISCDHARHQQPWKE